MKALTARRAEPADFADTTGHTRPLVHFEGHTQQTDLPLRASDAAVALIGIVFIVGFIAGVFG